MGIMECFEHGEQLSNELRYDFDKKVKELCHSSAGEVPPLSLDQADHVFHSLIAHACVPVRDFHAWHSFFRRPPDYTEARVALSVAIDTLVLSNIIHQSEAVRERMNQLSKRLTKPYRPI